MTKYLIIPNEKDLKAQLDLAAEFNTGFEYNDFYLPWVLDDKKRYSKIISRYKSEAALPSYNTMHGAFFDVLIFSDDRIIREASKKRVLQSMKIAEKAGCKGIVFHSNINPFLVKASVGESYTANWLSCHIDFYSEVCRKYPGIQVYIENMYDRNPDSLAELGKEMKSVPNFGLCFDYAHAQITGLDTKIWAEKLSPYIRHVHINDNDGKSDLHRAVGDGITDWEKFYALKNSLFPDASVLIETPGLENQIKSLEFLKKSNYM